MLFGNEGRSHNYHFTLELHTTFTYQPGQVFHYTGDDDMWVYINNRLVIDLGGVHQPASTSVVLDTLGLTPGNTYDFDLYFAERHTVSSVFHIQTSIVFDPQRRAGWHSNDGRNSLICESSPNCPGLSILLGNMYVYESPVVDPLYWYVQVIYVNMSLTERLPINCVGRADPALVKEHMQGTPNAGYVPASETFCSRTNFSGFIEPGGTHYEWAIFHNVPWPGKNSVVRIEWGPYGFSDWFTPWDRPYPDEVRKVSPPAECPDELVRFGKCQADSTRQPMQAHLSRTPEGKAPHLVLLVHGCCTTLDAYLREWYQERGDAVISAIARKNAEQKDKARAWEIVVRDWSNFTPPFNFTDRPIWVVAREAYNAAEGQGDLLANLIARYPNYKHIHLIAHSAGARLIHQTALVLSARYSGTTNQPFIHLTFLDAYTPSQDQVVYGFYSNFAEHYVDKTTSGFSHTDEDLRYGFNFNVTHWEHPFDLLNDPFNHQWPLQWYTRSIEHPNMTGLYGFKLSLEGGNEEFRELSTRFRPGGSCGLNNAAARCGTP